MSVFTLGCGANDAVLRSGNETPINATVREEKDPFAVELESMRTAKFSFIYVLRRKDGRTIEADDVSVIKQQTAETNRRIKADDDRAVIIGSNYQIPESNLAVLSGRFLVENYSEPPATDVNVNTNSNK